MSEAHAMTGAAGRPQTPLACARLVTPVSACGTAFPESWRMTPAFAPLSPP